MDKKDIFQEIGKKLPYEVPGGFFDHISNETLQNARKRIQKKEKTRVLWLRVVVAASLTALVFFSYYLIENKRPDVVVAEKKQSKLSSQPVPEKTEIMVDEARKAKEKIVEMPAVSQEEVKSQSVQPELKNDESVKDVLADLSDDELVQMVAMIQSDPFMDEVTE